MRIILFIALLAIGVTSAARMSRAVGGKPIPIENATFYVSIRWAHCHKCGGALLSRKHVITAESCVPDDELDLHPGLLSVVIATDLRKTDAVGRSIASVQRSSGVHGSPEREMGIAILTLSDSIPLNENVTPVLFPIENVPDDEQFESSEPLTAKLIALTGDRHSLHHEPLKRLEVLVNKCELPKLLCGRALAGAITHGDEGSPLIRNERIIGIALDHRMKMRSVNTYANVHSYWDFIFEMVYNV